MSASIEDKCSQLWGLLSTKAPTLRPKIIARGFDDDQLLALCKTDEQRQTLEGALDKFSSSKRGSCCSACGEVITESGGTFASEWEFDFDAKSQVLSKLAYLCETCYALSDLEEFLPRLAKPNADVLAHIAKFHTVNGISSDDMSPVMLVDYLEQCYSIAFALRIILANFPSWTLLDHHRRAFSAETDFGTIATECLSHVKRSSAPAALKPNPVEIVPSKPSKSHPRSHLFSLDTTPRKKDNAKRMAQPTVEDEVTSPAKKKAKR